LSATLLVGIFAFSDRRNGFKAAALIMILAFATRHPLFGRQA
jgi:hypothetical protein